MMIQSISVHFTRPSVCGGILNLESSSAGNKSEMILFKDISWSIDVLDCNSSSNRNTKDEPQSIDMSNFNRLDCISNWNYWRLLIKQINAYQSSFINGLEIRLCQEWQTIWQKKLVLRGWIGDIGGGLPIDDVTKSENWNEQAIIKVCNKTHSKSISQIHDFTALEVHSKYKFSFSFSNPISFDWRYISYPYNVQQMNIEREL